MDNENQTADTEQVSQEHLETILKLAHSGLSPDTISSCFRLSTPTVQRVIANDSMHKARVVQQLMTKDLQALQLQDTLPTFLYSYKYDTDQLHRTHLVTGEQSINRVPSYQFKVGCCWTEVQGGDLLITGGGVLQ
jgi:hypothetical protein